MKTLQYGLIGAKLGHSYSKQIHEMITDYHYELLELTNEELVEFMMNKPFKGINVTIPYKEAVLPYLDQIDEKADAIGAVNTIVIRDGKACGYNTDYLGFDYTLRHHNIVLNDKKVLILGYGGAAKAVHEVIKDHKAKEIVLVNRSVKPGTITFDACYQSHTDADVIINTTPVGMYPNIEESPLSLGSFNQLTAVIDIIYNPRETKLLLEAKGLGITAVNGMEMLVAQAAFAAELFSQNLFSEGLIGDICEKFCEKVKSF